MDNKKIEKMIAKAALGAAFAFLIGIVYTQGQHAEEDLDDYYLKQHNVPKKFF